MEGKTFKYLIKSGGINIPVSVSIILINKGALKAVAHLNFAGLILKDVRLIEDHFGNMSIVYPTREYKDKNGEVRDVQIFFPSNQLSSSLNCIVSEAYMSFVMDGDQLLKIVEETSSTKKKKKRKTVTGNSTDTKADTDLVDNENEIPPQEVEESAEFERSESESLSLLI